MTTITVTATVAINEKHLDKLNHARGRLGRQGATAKEEVENAVISALTQNMTFDHIVRISTEPTKP